MGKPNADSKTLIEELESIGSKGSFSLEKNPGRRRGGQRHLHPAGRLGAGKHGVAQRGSHRVAHPGEGSFIGLSSTLSCDHCCYSVDACEPCEFIFIPAERAQDSCGRRSGSFNCWDTRCRRCVTSDPNQCALQTGADCAHECSATEVVDHYVERGIRRENVKCNNLCCQEHWLWWQELNDLGYLSLASA